MRFSEFLKGKLSEAQKELERFISFVQEIEQKDSTENSCYFVETIPGVFLWVPPIIKGAKEDEFQNLYEIFCGKSSTNFSTAINNPFNQFENFVNANFFGKQVF